MIASGNSKSLCEFGRTGTKLTKVLNAATSLHQFNPLPWFKCANQNKAIGVAFDEHVQHPVNAVIEIDVRRACFVSLDKTARTRSGEGVRRFVIDCRVRFHLDDDPRAFAPNQFGADEFPRTDQRIALEERRAKK